MRSAFTPMTSAISRSLTPKVRVFPEPSLSTLVAKVGWDDTRPPVDYEREMFDQIPRRRTHRGGFDAEPLPGAIQSVLMNEAYKENAALRILSDEGPLRRPVGEVLF